MTKSECRLFREKLCFLRAIHNYSVAEIGRKLGSPGNNYARWESGRSMPSALSLFSLSRAFQVPMEYFLDDNIPVIPGFMEGIELGDCLIPPFRRPRALAETTRQISKLAGWKQ